MSKIEAIVAGVTFYDIDWEEVSPEAKAQLIPDPKNKHDPNAIRVMVAGKQIGHIKKTENIGILEKINSHNIERVYIKKIIGGTNHKNKGVVIKIVFKSKTSNNRDHNNLGEYNQHQINKFEVYRANKPFFSI